jgi:hypothetical protein
MEEEHVVFSKKINVWLLKKIFSISQVYGGTHCDIYLYAYNVA